MKKRLLFVLMAVCSVLSSFALEPGDFAKTVKGRYQITGSTNLYTGSFNVDGEGIATIVGWNVLSATEGTTVLDQVNVVKDEEAELVYVTGKQAAFSTEGMTYALPTLYPAKSYIVAIKMKSAATAVELTTKSEYVAKATQTGMNYINLVGVAEGYENVVYGQGQELTSEWKEYFYAIPADPEGPARAITLTVSGLSTTCQIADIAIMEAMQKQDREAIEFRLKYATDLVKLWDWEGEEGKGSFDVDAYYNLADFVAGFDDEEICDADINDEDAKKALTDMENYIAAMEKNLTQNLSGYTLNPASKQRGDWQGYKAGTLDNSRFNGSYNYCDYPHYYLGSHDAAGPFDIRYTANLKKGVAIFALNAYYARPLANSSKVYEVADGFAGAKGFIYIRKGKHDVNTTEAEDTLVKAPVFRGAYQDGMMRYYVMTQIVEDGDYTIGVSADPVACAVPYKRNGMMMFEKCSLLNYLDAEYTQDQLNYIADVREQITVGRSSYDKSVEEAADEQYTWGREALAATIADYKEGLEDYEEAYMAEGSEDDILETYDPEAYNHDNRTKTEEEGLLVYTIYDNVVKGLLAANNFFHAKNDTLAKLAPAIEAAEVYTKINLMTKSSKYPEFVQAIADAKQLDADLHQADYSQENAKAIMDMIEKLNTLGVQVSDINTLPESMVKTEVIDIDFTNIPVSTDPEVDITTTAHEATVTGAKGVMTIGTCLNSTTGNEAFYAPGDVYGEAHAGALILGQGPATVDIPAANADFLVVSFDMYYSRISKGASAESDTNYEAFYLVNKDEEGNETNITGLSFSPYWSKIYYNPTDLAANSNTIPSLGSSSAQNQNIHVESNKTHFEIFVDNTTNTAYMTESSRLSTQLTVPVEIEGLGVNMFKLETLNGTKNFARCPWFDNLKVMTINDPTGVKDYQAEKVAVAVPAKRLVNGKIVISKAGKLFNAAGALIK